MQQAVILKSGRRQARVYVYQTEETHNILIERKHADLVAGDLIELTKDLSISNVHLQTNTLSRSNGYRTKTVAANLDLLFLITAPQPLFNPDVIDRTLLAATEQEIPTVLIVNKKDLAIADLDNQINYYRDKICPVITTAAAEEFVEIDQLESLVKKQKPFARIAVSGVSGVGKSSLLCELCKDYEFITQEVSDKTGQGRQTTSRVTGYVLPEQKIIFDVPGVQNFGVASLTREDVRLHFPDFRQLAADCAYRSCLHLEEADCRVRTAVRSGQILESRYTSYLKIISEITAAKPY